MVAGGEWDTVITVNNPKIYIIVTTLGFTIWIFFKTGSPPRPRSEWQKPASESALLGMGCLLAVAAGELTLRWALSHNAAGVHSRIKTD